MNYETALELKNAGFPQEHGNGYHYTSNSVVRRNNQRIKTEDCYAPTLEELIEFSDGYGRVEELIYEYSQKALQKLRGKQITE